MKSILWISVVLVGVLIPITPIRWLLPKGNTVTREARFASLPVIWRTITDVDAMPAWGQGLKGSTVS
jgi:hypothetical protein